MTRQLEKSIFQEMWRIEPKNSLLLLYENISEAKSRICGVCFFFFFRISHSFHHIFHNANEMEKEKKEINLHIWNMQSQFNERYLSAFTLFTVRSSTSLSWITLLYFTFSQSFVWRSDIIFSFCLVCVSDCLRNYTFTTMLCVMDFFFIAIFIFPYFVLSISLHFPFFVRSIHQAQIHVLPYTYCTHTYTHKHPRTERMSESMNAMH